MKMLKRSMAMLLVLCMLVGLVPMNTFADEINGTDTNVTETVEGTEEETSKVIEEETTEEVSEVIEEETTEEVSEVVEEETTEEVSEVIKEETTEEVSEVIEEETTEEVLEVIEEKTIEEALEVIEEETTETTEETTEATENTGNEALSVAMFLSDAGAATFDEFVRAFALDCGRIYFSVDDIKEIIDVMAKNDYTHLTLAFGNSGFRFLLDDMTIGNYSGDAVKNAILAGNTNYVANDGHNNSSAANTCLSQADMDAIISYANSKGIEIMPALNSPGHMNTIVYAMDQLGIENAGYPVSDTYNSESTININNTDVTNFVSELLQKYINYFADKGCTMFNLGADEFANDPTDDVKLSGFTSMNDTLKNSFISYVNSAATMVSNAGMIPMMFNDGYAWSDAQFNKDIVVCYWTSGAVSSTDIANAGHNVINNSQRYYYVLGEPFGTESNNWCSYASATNGVTNVPVNQMVDSGKPGGKLVGAQMFLWCDYTDKTYTADEENKVKTLISTLAANNPDYFTIEEEPAEPETRSVTMQVNQSVTDTIDGQQYTEYQIEDTSKVSVSLTQVEGTAETTVSTTPATELEDGATYILRVYNTVYALSTEAGRGDWGTSTLAFQANSLTANENHLWTLEAVTGGYKLKSADGYLNLGTGNNAAYLNDTGEVFTLTYTDTGWTIGNTSGRYINALGGLTTYYSAGGWTGDGTRFDLYKVTTATAASTEVAFTGLEIGTTTVTVGHVTYTVTVTEEDISNVTLTYHPWISTYSVHEEGHNDGNNPGIANPQTLAANANGVYSEEGAVFADFVWATGDWKWEGDAQTHYWKATVLPEGFHQEGQQSTDRSMSGTDFTYIRYWGGVWSYSSDRVTWTDVQNTDEVCAYYLQKTEVTTEVDTYVKDWAFTTENASGQDENRYQKALSFAVVYPDGTMNPSEDNIYANSTLIYWDNLADLGFIRIGVTDYAVSKITYTLGERAKGYTAVNWTTYDSITWEKNTVGDVTWYDETVCWDKTYGTEPVVNGQDLNDAIYAGDATGDSTYYNGTWGANDAVLILIYLEPIVTEDSLTVVYYDEKFGDTLYTYTIAVPAESNFNNGVGSVVTDDDGNITIDTTTTPGAFAGNTARIDVTGFGITNNLNVAQKFQTDLTKVPDAIGKYNSSLYKYTGSEIKDDGKTLYLYYNIDTSVLSPNYVIDFGLPITFNLSALLGAGTETNEVTAVSGLSARYGTLAYNSTDKEFTYTPTTILQNIDVLSITLTIDGKANTTNVGVTPATTVYYGEQFLSFSSGWSTSGTYANVGSQATEVLGKSSYYGYDTAYQNCAGASDGTARRSNSIGEAATFSFTGTGIQVFANSSSGFGYVSVMVKNKTTGAIANVSMVDTDLTGTVDTDTTGGQIGKNLSGLPVVSLVDLTGLTYGTYEVTINKVMDSDPVYIDGIRVFETVGTVGNQEYFVNDKEDNPDFYEVRDLVLKAINITAGDSSDYKTLYQQIYTNTVKDGASAVITNASVNLGTMNRQDLLDNGPKNELYLFGGDTLTLNVSTDRVIQLGLKAPEGSAVFTLNGEEKTLSTTVDMFYKIAEKGGTSHTITITNTSGNILSVTLLKICDDPNVTFPALTEDNIKNILKDAGYTEIPTEPEKPAYTMVELKSTDVLIDGTVFDYTGEAIEPAITVNVDGAKLVEGKDYSVTYINNVEPGTATAIVRGIATASETLGYTGEISINYTINAPVVCADAVLSVNVVDYTGAVLSTVELVANGVEGENALFTAEEILNAAKNQIPENYVLVDETTVADVETMYGENKEIDVQIGKVAVLNIAFVNLLGKKQGAETITVVQTASGYCRISASEIKALAPAGRRAIWFLPAYVPYGNTVSIIVPII